MKRHEKRLSDGSRHRRQATALLDLAKSARTAAEAGVSLHSAAGESLPSLRDENLTRQKSAQFISIETIRSGPRHEREQRNPYSPSAALFTIRSIAG